MPDDLEAVLDGPTTTLPHGAVAIGMSILYAFVTFAATIGAGSGESPPK
jgi:hypothetical protein